MAEINIEEKIEEAKARLYDSDNIIWMKRKNINRLKKHIERLIKNGTIKKEELREFLHKEYNEVLYEYLQIAGTGIAQKQLQALKIINNNPYILDKVYEEIKDENLENVNFEEKARNSNGTEEEFEKNEICIELNQIRTESRFISEKVIELYKKIFTEKDVQKRKEYKASLVKKQIIKIFLNI